MKEEELLFIIEGMRVESFRSLNFDWRRQRINVPELIELTKALARNNSVKRIDFRGNAIGEAGARAIAEALKVNNGVRLIHLGGNHIGEAGATAVAKALTVNTAVQSICLSANSIDDPGAAAIAAALEFNATVQAVYLHENNIGKAGATTIAAALKVNNSLQTLELHWNPIGDVGAIAIAEALKINSRLQSLRLSWTLMGDTGAMAIAEALKVNTTLLSINLRENMIGNAGGKAIAQALKINSTLTKISGEFSEDISDEIEKELEVNLSFHAWRAQLYDCRNTDLPYQTKCAVLKAICSQMIEIYPGLMSEPQSVPQKALDLFTEVDIEISTTAVLIDHAHIFLITDKTKDVLRAIISIENQELIDSCTASHVQPLSLQSCRQLLTTLQPKNQYLTTLVSNLTKHISDSEKALRTIIDLLQYQLKPEVRHRLIESCIQQLRGKEALLADAPLPLSSYRLLLEAALKVGPTLTPALKSFVNILLLQQDYHHRTAGKLMAIGEVMSYLGMPAVLQRNPDAALLIDNYISEDCMPVFLQETSITEDNVAQCLVRHNHEIVLAALVKSNLFQNDKASFDTDVKQFTNGSNH